MTPEQLKHRTKAFAIRIIRLVDSLPATIGSRAVANQIVRSGTAVAANYRASCRARSHKEFIAKIGIVEEESDETLFWLEVLAEANIVDSKKLAPLMDEASQLTAIFCATGRTAKTSPK